MFLNKEFRVFANINQIGWKFLMLTGFAVVLSGVIVLLFPEILITLIAALLFLIGVTIMLNAWHLRKQDTDCQRTIRIRWFN
jgi:hypothetical protein